MIPGVCGVVQGSVHPAYTGIEAGLSATGDIFEAIARRAGTTVAELSQGPRRYRAGQTGLLRLTWDNGDRTVLVNPELGGVTLGWNLTHTAQDELFAAIEGTAFHTRIILERMAEHGVPIRRVINGGGIPQKNEVLNQRLRQRPEQAGAGAGSRGHQPGLGHLRVSGRGSVSDHRRGAAGAVPAVPRRSNRRPAAAAVYEELYERGASRISRLGRKTAEPAAIGDLLPLLRRVAKEAHNKNDAFTAVA